MTPWTVAHQAPPSKGFSRQEHWSGLPFPSPGDLPDPGIKPRSPALQADSLPSETREAKALPDFMGEANWPFRHDLPSRPWPQAPELPSQPLSLLGHLSAVSVPPSLWEVGASAAQAPLAAGSVSPWACSLTDAEMEAGGNEAT